jgi:[ribosomal protein S5]-alanine N-acetyltransferase
MPLLSPNLLETDRLWMRLAAESDLPALMEVNGDEEVTKFLPYAAWKSMSEAEAWFQRMSDHQASGSAFQFVIVAKETGKAIGTCLLFDIEKDNAHAEFGYVLGRAYWRRGYMREALTALIGFAFQELCLRRLEAQVESQNIASTRLLLRLGFTREGVLRERWIAKTGPMDAEVYGLLRHEWPDSRRSIETAPDR